jgi:hypothetical protein
VILFNSYGQIAGRYFQFNCDYFLPHYFHLIFRCCPVIRLYTVRDTNGIAGCTALKYSATIFRVLLKFWYVSVCVSCVEIKRRIASFFVFVSALPYWLIFLLHSKHDDESIRAPNKCPNLVKFRGSEDVLSCQPPQRCNRYGRHDTRLAGKKEELGQQSDKGHMQRMDLQRVDYRGSRFLQNVCTSLLHWVTSYPRRVIFTFTAVRTSGLT